MPKVFIPQVGDKIELSSNWNCKIFNESRNRSVFEALGVDVSEQKDSNIDITFLKGTVFKVTRLYVRAPASSYDSITLSVVSSPIKKLSKAKFWVKIMDANNMEFEEKEQSFDEFENISDLFRYLGLQDGYSNPSNIPIKDKQPYFEKILSDFYNPDKVISFDLEFNKQGIFNTYVFKEVFYSWQNNEQQVKKEQDYLFKLLPDKAVITITIFPVLQGYIFRRTSVEEITKIDKELNYFEQYCEYNSRRLGSDLAYGYLYLRDNFKKAKFHYLDYAMENNLDFNVNGKIQKIKNKKEFNKIMTNFNSLNN